MLRTSGRRNLNHADSDPATHAHSSRRKQTKNHRRICRTREFQNILASVAHMRSPQGWLEPGQTPEFDEFTIVLKGTLRVEHKGGTLDVHAGQALVAHAGEWVRYSTPEDGGAEYVAVCLPAFSMETVHRDE